MTVVLPYHSRFLTTKHPSILMVMNFEAKITFQNKFSFKARSIEFIVISTYSTPTDYLINDLQITIVL